MSAVIAPSILSSNFANLEKECQNVLDAGADWLHVDVMDGHFVPNITIGIPVVESLRASFPETFIDVHLMISDPDTYAPQFAAAGANMVTFHPETTPHSHRVVQRIHDRGAEAGLAFNPATPIEHAEHLVDLLDMMLIMSVNPGFSGQDFIPETLNKLRQTRSLLDQHGRSDMLVEVDGGVSVDNIGEIFRAGADVFVSGSSIFGADSYEDQVQAMKDQVRMTESI